MEGLRNQVARQRCELGIKEDKKNPLPEGQKLVREFLENSKRLLVKKDGEKGEKEEKKEE